jgi:hypothetical protein
MNQDQLTGLREVFANNLLLLPPYYLYLYTKKLDTNFQFRSLYIFSKSHQTQNYMTMKFYKSIAVII